MSKPRHLMNLNKQQRKAVMHGSKKPLMIDGPELIIAGAGTGKTRVLAARYVQLLLSGVDANRILLLTFTNKAAQEMTERVKAETGQALGENGPPWAGTFHSIACRLLRRYGQEVGISPSFTILDASDAASFIGRILQEQGLGGAGFPGKGQCLYIYSLRANSALKLRQLLRRRFPPCLRWHDELRRLFRAYDASKRKQNVVDFDDLLTLCWKLLKQPRLARKIGWLFDHVIVDEYQDTNALQAKILVALKPRGSGVTVVGDDDQAIYSFRGTTVRNILGFPSLFSPQARIIELKRNYRSTQAILNACNAVIGRATGSRRKRLFSRRRSGQKPTLAKVRDVLAQAQYVADQIEQGHETGVPWKDQAVLFRVADDSAHIEAELTKRDIPFEKWGGARFLDAAHIKDALSVLRWCQNPSDEVAALRALQLLPGIGPSTASAIFRKTKGYNLFARLKSTQPPRVAKNEWKGFLKTLKIIRVSGQSWPQEFRTLCDWLSLQLRRIYDDRGGRIEDLKRLGQIATTFDSREDFLSNMVLQPSDVPRPGPDGFEGRVVLSTIHSAKGHEWRSVTVINAVDGCIPFYKANRSPEGIEEERRVLYVAMTRAKDTLRIVVPQYRFTHRNAKTHQRAKRTRFLPVKLKDIFDYRDERLDVLNQRSNGARPKR